jgi:hypothetical protein
MRVIILALLGGVATFAVISVLVGNNQPAPPNIPLVTYIAVAYGGIAIVASAVVPKLVTHAARQKIKRDSPSDVTFERWCDVFQTGLIIGGAFLEGSAFLFLVAYLVESNLLSFLAVIPVAGLAMKVPSQSGVKQWIEDQQRLLEQEQAAA